MKLLVFGAGALGTLYAARFAAAGHDVALLARGRRLAELRAHGVRIRERGARETASPPVRLVERVDEAPHDAIVVLVRRHQVDDVVALLAASPDASDVLMMVNATGYAAWRAALGGRLVVGFAGAAASFAGDGALEYVIAPALLQPTVLGEPDGSASLRVERLSRVFADAGFPVRVRGDMEAWQLSHAAWITPFMLAAAAVDGDPTRFAEPAHVRPWMDATKETLAWVRAHGRLVPAGLGAAASLPTSLLTALARLAVSPRGLRTQLVATGLDSRSEGLALSAELLALARETGAALPQLQRLRSLASARPAR